ncbi:MAG: hypothetical protein WC238_00805 [Parcubacteria group bacterium]
MIGDSILSGESVAVKDVELETNHEGWGLRVQMSARFIKDADHPRVSRGEQTGMHVEIFKSIKSLQKGE